MDRMLCKARFQPVHPTIKIYYFIPRNYKDGIEKFKFGKANTVNFSSRVTPPACPHHLLSSNRHRRNPSLSKPDQGELNPIKKQAICRRKSTLVWVASGGSFFNPARDGGFQFSPSDRSDNRLRACVLSQCVSPR